MKIMNSISCWTNNKRMKRITSVPIRNNYIDLYWSVLMIINIPSLLAWTFIPTNYEYIYINHIYNYVIICNYMQLYYRYVGVNYRVSLSWPMSASPVFLMTSSAPSFRWLLSPAPCHDDPSCAAVTNFHLRISPLDVKGLLICGVLLVKSGRFWKHYRSIPL